MLSTTVAGIKFETCIYNASGAHCTSFMELRNLYDSKSCAILTKSCTLHERQGNQEPRYWHNNSLSINSTGLANNGYGFYKYLCGYFDKPYIISVAGLTLDDNIKIITELNNSEAKPNAIELNLSCPNLAGQVAYDFESMNDYLNKIYDVNEIPLGIKLSPYFDRHHFGLAADVIKQYPVTFVTCINSLGNGLIIEDEKTVIAPNQGFGGIGGTVILPFALSNVKKFRELLPERIDIVGCGGVTSGEEVFKHILCGASAVQVGTQLVKEGVDVFQRLNDELTDIMTWRGYSCLDNFRGKVVAF